MELTDLFKGASVNSPVREEDMKMSALNTDQEGWMYLMNKRIREMVDSVGDLSTQFQHLKTEVGEPQEPLARAGPSIWNTIESATPDLQKLLQDPPSLKELREAVFNNKGFVSYLTSTKAAVDSITARVGKLELARANRSSAGISNPSFFDSYSLGVAATNATPVPGSVYSETLATLAQKIADLERAKNGSTSRGEITVVFKDPNQI